MTKERQIAIIIEGEVYEKKIVNSIKRNFFSGNNKYSYTIISLPMASNIYVLWKELQSDKYLDIIELVRERTPKAQKALEGLTRDSFSEVYLFFDYDSQQNNLKLIEDADKVLLEMLDLFDNETENGKLYISYPMAEAIKDQTSGTCHTHSGSCFLPAICKNYKSISGANNPLSHINNFTINKWADTICTYRGRLSCLLNKQSLLTINDCKEFTIKQIHEAQRFNETELKRGMEVLSAFPKFLIDYFKEDYLEKIISSREFTYPRCQSGEMPHDISNSL